jgi:hypothetical protein
MISAKGGQAVVWKDASFWKLLLTRSGLGSLVLSFSLAVFSVRCPAVAPLIARNAIGN